MTVKHLILSTELVCCDRMAKTQEPSSWSMPWDNLWFDFPRIPQERHDCVPPLHISFEISRAAVILHIQFPCIVYFLSFYPNLSVSSMPCKSQYVKWFPRKQEICMHFFATLRPESISVRGISSYKISTTETADLVFVLLDNDLIISNYRARKNVPWFHGKQNTSGIKTF